MRTGQPVIIMPPLQLEHSKTVSEQEFNIPERLYRELTDPNNRLQLQV